MLRSSFVAGLSALVLVTLAACAETSPQSPPVTGAAAPITSAASSQSPAIDPSDPGAPAFAAAPSDAGTTMLATADASPPVPDEGVDPQYRACSVDTDCVSVERVGCCHNGRKVGVAASQKDAYLQSFTCPTKHPKCPMYRIKQDDRVAACDGATHLCGLK